MAAWRHCFYSVMAEANDESLIHRRESFGRFIEVEVNTKNITIITKAELQEIKKYFLGTINVRSTKRRKSRSAVDFCLNPMLAMQM